MELEFEGCLIPTYGKNGKTIWNIWEKWKNHMEHIELEFQGWAYIYIIYIYLLWLIASFTHTSVQVVGTSPSAWDPLKSTFEARTYGPFSRCGWLRNPRNHRCWLPWWWEPIIGHLFVEDGYGWLWAPTVRRSGRLHRVKSGQWADLFEASYT